MKKNKRHIILATGGTGGHIYPAIAVAQYIQQEYEDATFLFIGSKYKMEMKVVPKYGFDIIGLPIKGFSRSSMLKNLFLPFLVLASFYQSLTILIRYKPSVVVGFGGFASFCILKTSQWLSIPTIIHEQNSILGLSNKILSKSAKKVCVSFNNAKYPIDKSKIVVTGNPVRNDFYCNSFLSSKPSKNTSTTLLIVGGSLGAEPINRFIKDNLDNFINHNIEIHWQTGSGNYDTYKVLENKNKGIFIYDFLDDIPKHYKKSDIIISRAGASTIAELTYVGKAVIFIPLPHATANHQYYNALELANQEAAELVRQDELKSKGLKVIYDLATNALKQKKLSENIITFRKSTANRDIANEITHYTK